MRGPNRKRVLLCGPSRDAVGGVSTHMNQFFGSPIAEKYTLLQFQVGSAGRSERILGKLLRFATSPLELARQIVRLRPDILHLNTSLVPTAYWRDLTYLIVRRCCAARLSTRFMAANSPFRFLGKNALGQAFLRWSLRIPDAIVLLAEVERDSFRSFAVPSRTYLIPNAIDLEEYRAVQPKSFDGPALDFR
jgi:glycosyltransferase involved in cell wall biosynthesis